MKLCRFLYEGAAQCGTFDSDAVVPLLSLAKAAGESAAANALETGRLESLLPIESELWRCIESMVTDTRWAALRKELAISRNSVRLLPPIASPGKLLMLAGNYAAHVKEQGGVSEKAEDTFPYVFMKPPSTTLVGDGTAFRLPNSLASSGSKLDHEVELAVVIGKTARNVPPTEALCYVAGYTIINDISDRGFRPNPNRVTRPKDGFFDWLHGKWHDGSCPCGPCLVSADEVSDPQQLRLTLTVDGELRQEGCTSEQTFGVAEVIAFLSNWMTLEPGDMISTGTPKGVGNASGKYLQAGQTMVCEIEGIGQLMTPVVDAS